MSHRKWKSRSKECKMSNDECRYLIRSTLIICKINSKIFVTRPRNYKLARAHIVEDSFMLDLLLTFEGCGAYFYSFFKEVINVV